MANEIGMTGIGFVEFTAPQTQSMKSVFKDFGFSVTSRHSKKNIELLKQSSMLLILNSEKSCFASQFAEAHGESICSMGWKFNDAAKAYEMALARGAKPAKAKDYSVPAILGIGDSLIYFLDQKSMSEDLAALGFVKADQPEVVPEKGFLEFDHLTNNVYKGTMHEWANFYKNIFGFVEVRYFDIRGQKTGLVSYALRSPDGSFCIPINEGTEKKSQINEYLEEYNGPGVQHLAFLTNDILASLDQLRGSRISMLDIDPNYYTEAFQRVPKVTEDRERIKGHSVLVDGDEEGYLLQIFTKNLFGPIFIELIQRKNHLSFGEGNFKALFDSIERDQAKRGYL